MVAGATATGKIGHIGDGLSPLDPIFWLHHCMVDRVWAEWQQAGNTTQDPGETYAGNFFDKAGAPVDATAGGAQSTTALGYTYDVLEAATPPVPSAETLLGPIMPDLERALTEGRTPETLGSAESGDLSAALAETAIKVPAPGLFRALASDRAFRRFSLHKEPTTDREGRRILARFPRVLPPEGRRDLVVNVFVSCPYLSPSTPYVDPHYAGTFSFFGAMAHGSHDMEVVVDLTDPVRSLAGDGRLREEQLTVQLMPLPAHMESESGSTFRAGRVEILAV